MSADTQDRQYRRRMPRQAAADAARFNQEWEMSRSEQKSGGAPTPPEVGVHNTSVSPEQPVGAAGVETATPPPAPAGPIPGVFQTPAPVNTAAPANTPTTANTSAPDNSELYRRQIEDLQRQLQESKAALQQASNLSTELQTLKDEHDLEELWKSVGSEFASIDPEDAKKLLTPVLKAIRQQSADSTATLNKKLEEQHQSLQNKVKDLENEANVARMRKVQETILKAVPDLEALQKTDAYKTAMMAPIAPHSNVLTGQLVAAEYERGNTDYVIGVLNSIKGQTNLDSVASVSPSSMGASQVKAPEAESDGILTADEIADMTTRLRMRQMTRQEFQEAMKKHREAQAANR